MNDIFAERINKLADSSSHALLAGGMRGIEKESLRVTQDGLLSQLSHPEALGSALTNRFITTDFSEALLEFVTPACNSTWEALQFLLDIHQFSYARMGEELLWATSMPCSIPAGSRIPLARYGDSNVGQMKTVYRNGLGHRYGRTMQTIAGIHFNYSLPMDFWPVYQEMERNGDPADEFRSNAYLGLIRNFRRMGWLVLYLFGASPALCRSFAGDSSSIDMPELTKDTLFEPYGTSLRMSDLGYSNNTQANLSISLNNLDEYIRDLSAAINTREPAFEEIGVKVDGEYRQLSANTLQIENEYYSSIRPKRVAMSGERPTAALRRGGIEYVEVRSLDINVFDPVGVNQNVMRFVEAFLIYCLLSDSPPFDAETLDITSENQRIAAKNGRDPNVMLVRRGEPVRLREWAAEIVAGVRQVAELIDRDSNYDDYANAVDAQAEVVRNSEETPSARILQELKTAGCGFYDFALAAAKSHKEYFAQVEELPDERLQLLDEEAAASHARQREIEEADEISFDEYLEHYFRSG